MDKFEVLKAMNTIVMAINDETAYYRDWIWLIPDEADDDELRQCAEDDEIFSDAVKQFIYIMKIYGVNGLYVDKKLYKGK